MRRDGGCLVSPGTLFSLTAVNFMLEVTLIHLEARGLQCFGQRDLAASAGFQWLGRRFSNLGSSQRGSATMVAWALRSSVTGGRSGQHSCH